MYFCQRDGNTESFDIFLEIFQNTKPNIEKISKRRTIQFSTSVSFRKIYQIFRNFDISTQNTKLVGRFFFKIYQSTD